MKRLFTLWFAALLFLTACGGQQKTEQAENPKPLYETGSPAEAVLETTEKSGEKIELMLGVLDNSAQHKQRSEIYSLVGEFNNQNAQYHVTIKNYREDGKTLEQGRQSLVTELLAGGGPDMLVFDNLSPLPLIAKGLLLDLDTLADGDPGVTEKNLVIWNALHEYGRMYLIAPRFILDTVKCLPETKDDIEKWDIQTYLEMEAALDDGTEMIYHMTPQNFVERLAVRYLPNAMDLEMGTCSFDNEEFVEILAAACRVGSYDSEKNDTEAWKDGVFQTASQRIAAGQLLFCAEWAASVEDLAYNRTITDGAELVYIGWPAPDGESGGRLVLQMPIGICSRTSQPQGCWELLKYILKHPRMDQNHPGFPCDLTKYQLMVAQTCDSLSNYQDLVRMDANNLLQRIRAYGQMGFYDEAVMNIILEEADAMFEGNATAEEVARRVQDRASLYMMEQYG